MVRVFLITVNKVYRQRVFVTVACHGHGSAVYACIFFHGSVLQFLIPGSSRICKDIGVTRGSASRFQQLTRDTLPEYPVLHP